MRPSSLCVSLLVVLVLTAAAQADAWPSRPVRWIVPYPPGGGTDTVSRVVAAKLTDALGRQFVVENKAGGNTIIGTAAVAQAAPDGYTIGLIADPHAANLAAERVMPYDTITKYRKIFAVIGKPQ